MMVWPWQLNLGFPRPRPRTVALVVIVVVTLAVIAAAVAFGGGWICQLSNGVDVQDEHGAGRLVDAQRDLVPRDPEAVPARREPSGAPFREAVDSLRDGTALRPGDLLQEDPASRVIPVRGEAHAQGAARRGRRAFSASTTSAWDATSGAPRSAARIASRTFEGSCATYASSIGKTSRPSSSASGCAAVMATSVARAVAHGVGQRRPTRLALRTVGPSAPLGSRLASVADPWVRGEVPGPGLVEYRPEVGDGEVSPRLAACGLAGLAAEVQSAIDRRWDLRRGRVGEVDLALGRHDDGRAQALALRVVGEQGKIRHAASVALRLTRGKRLRVPTRGGLSDELGHQHRPTREATAC